MSDSSEMKAPAKGSIKASATDVDRQVEKLASQLADNSQRREISARIQELARWRRNNLVNLPSLED